MSEDRPGWFGRVVTGLPSRLPVAFFWATVVVAGTVSLAAFRPWVVLPLWVLLLALTWRFVPQAVPLDAAHRRGAVWALVLTTGWVLVNVWWAGEVLLVQRDPGFLTLEAVWLTDNADPVVGVRSAAEVAEQVPTARLNSDAFWLSGQSLYAQGTKTFPGLLAIVGWVAGVRGVLVGNLLIAGVALLACYDVARRLIGPLWGLVPIGALALTTPMIYFSRSAFTEPTNIALTFGGLAVLWSAGRDPRLWRFALGGAMVGATALIRIDGAAVSGGLILGLGVVAAVSEPALRRARLAGLLAATVTALAMVALGYLDLARNSPGYLAEHENLYAQLLGLVGGCLVLALVLVALMNFDRLRTLVVTRLAGLGSAAAVLVVLAGLVLASRPLWMTAHWFEGRANYMAVIASIQQAAGVAVDGSRSYDEATVKWLFWYLGPVTLVLAVAGAALLVRRGIATWRPELLVLLGTLLVPSLLYILRPSITPDQIWAMRRLLPAAIPAALLFAGWTLPRIARASTSPGRRVGLWAVVGSVLLAPLVTWGTLVVAAQYGGRAEQVDQICHVLQGERVVVVRGASPPWLPTLRIMCDADVVEVGSGTDAETLARIKRAWGGEVFAFTDAGQSLPWANSRPDPWLSRPLTRWPVSLYPAFAPVRYTNGVWIARIRDDGTVSAVSAPIRLP